MPLTAEGEREAPESEEGPPRLLGKLAFAVCKQPGHRTRKWDSTEMQQLQ